MQAGGGDVGGSATAAHGQTVYPKKRGTCNRLIGPFLHHNMPWSTASSTISTPSLTDSHWRMAHVRSVAAIPSNCCKVGRLWSEQRKSAYQAHPCVQMPKSGVALCTCRRSSASAPSASMGPQRCSAAVPCAPHPCPHGAGVRSPVPEGIKIPKRIQDEIHLTIFGQNNIQPGCGRHLSCNVRLDCIHHRVEPHIGEYALHVVQCEATSISTPFKFVAVFCSLSSFPLQKMYQARFFLHSSWSVGSLVPLYASS